MIAVTCVDEIPTDIAEDTLISIPYRKIRHMQDGMDDAWSLYYEAQDETKQMHGSLVECLRFMTDDQLTLVVLNTDSNVLAANARLEIRIRKEKERRDRGV